VYLLRTIWIGVPIILVPFCFNISFNYFMENLLILKYIFMKYNLLYIYFFSVCNLIIRNVNLTFDMLYMKSDNILLSYVF